MTVIDFIGEIMDKEFEKKICDAFFDKRCSERLFYELSSQKKRRDFLDKMCHTADRYIGDCVYKKFGKLPSREEIAAFLDDESCYFITPYEKNDGGNYDTSRTLEEIWSDGSAYMIVSRDCTRAYLETEYSFSGHTAYFLKIH